MLSPEDLPEGIEAFCGREKDDWVIVEPQTILEDFLLPFSLVVSAAKNRAEIGALLNDRYDVLLEKGNISYLFTDIAL